MAEVDKERWNIKYQDNKIPNDPIVLVKTYASLASGVQSLDIACGMGRHAKYLATQGFSVDALDISSVAIQSLSKIPDIHPQEVDFDNYVLPKEKYDLIVCTYFLARSLFPQIVDALHTGGILLYETFVADAHNERTPSNPDFILQKNELKSFFSTSCEIIHYREFLDVDYTGAKTMKASMVAKKN